MWRSMAARIIYANLVEPTFQWQALISIVGITTASLIIAIKRFEQTDY